MKFQEYTRAHRYCESNIVSVFAIKICQELYLIYNKEKRKR